MRIARSGNGQGPGGGSGVAPLLLHGAATSEGSARLLERFAVSRDEASFAALVTRYGPMVRSICQRLLPNPADADDAFQATFVVLARRAGSITDGDRLAPWLHGVACRVAARSRRGSARRRQREVSNHELSEGGAVDPPPADGFELRSILDEELARLPGKYRAPLILCDLDGLSSDEAARQLAWPVGTVRTRLAGARARLRSRLTRRGYAPSALVLPSLTPSTLQGVPLTLQASTVRLALGSLAVGTSGAPAAVLLARGVLAPMLTTKLLATTLGLAATATLAVGTTGLIAAQGPAPASRGGAPATTPAPGRTAADRLPIDPPPDTPPVDELAAARLRIQALEAELASRPPLAGPVDSVVRNDPPLLADDGSGRQAVLPPPGSPVTAEQAQLAYFNDWTFDLPEGWKLHSPQGRDRTTLFHPGLGRHETFEGPGQITTVVPVVSGSRVGLHLVGPRIGEVAAYSPTDQRWSRQTLRAGPIAGRIMPTLLENLVEYTVGRHVYAYSLQANRWGVLELAVAPSGTVPAGSILGPSGMTIPEGNIRHIFDAATGEWTHQSVAGPNLPVGGAGDIAPSQPAPPTEPTPAAPLPPLRPTPPVSGIPEPSLTRIDYAHPDRYLVLHPSFGDPALIHRLAGPLQADSTEQTLGNIGRWIARTLRHDARAAYEYRDVDAACRAGVYGGCADHAVVFAALARACGIPTVFVKSMDVDWIREFRSTGTCQVWSGHVFLEVYLAGQWRLLDASTLQLFDDYTPALRILPGNRFAYDKGSDPRELVLSPDWERWQRQTAAYFAGFDVAQLPVGSGRAVAAQDDVLIAADSPIYQAVTERVRALGFRPQVSFNTDYGRYLPQARGKILIVTRVGDRMVPPAETLGEILAFPATELTRQLTGGESGVARQRLDDGTRVVLLSASNLADLLKLVATLELLPNRVERAR